MRQNRAAPASRRSQSRSLLQDHSGEQRVTNIELLFDLVNVFAVTQMSHHLLALWPGPGDLLFHHTDPTDPGHILYVAIYLADGKMIQAPETGENVEVVPADTRSEFARGDPGGPGAGRPGGRKYLTTEMCSICSGAQQDRVGPFARWASS